MLAAVENDLKVQFVPRVPRKNLFQIALRLDDVFPATEFPSLCQAVNMGIDRKCGNTKGLRHYHGCGFVAYSREFLEFFETLWNFASVFFDEDSAEIGDRSGLGWGKSTGTYDRADLLDGDVHHFLGSIGECKKCRGNEIDADVGALGREENRDQQGVGACMIEWNGCFRIEFLESAEDMIGSLLFQHGLVWGW